METECWLYTFLVCAVLVRWALSLGRVRDVDKIQSHGAVMSVAANHHGEMDSKLIHVPSADTWGPSPAGGGGKDGTLGTRRSVHQIRGTYIHAKCTSAVCGPLQNINLTNSNTMDVKYNTVSDSNTPACHMDHTHARTGAERAEIQMLSPPALLNSGGVQQSRERGCVASLRPLVSKEYGMRRKRQIVSWVRR